MNDEEFEKLFDREFQDKIGTNNDVVSLEEVAEKASTFEAMQEISEYMKAIIEKVSKYKQFELWEVLFKNLSIETLDENFNELLGMLEEYKKSSDWYDQKVIQNVIPAIPQEVMARRFEELSIFVLDEKNTLPSINKLSILYQIPVNFKEPEQYKKIFDLLETVEPGEVFYKTEIKKRIIKALPKEFVFENYEDISRELFSIKSILKDDVFNFIKNTFSSDSEIDDEILFERFEVIKGLLDQKSNDFDELKKEVYSNLVNYLPKTFLRGRVEEFIPFIDSNLYDEVFEKLFKYNQGEELDEELLLKNMTLVNEYIKQKEKYKYRITDEHLKILSFLPNEFVKGNIIACLESFDESTYKELLPKFLESIDRSDYESLKNTITWLSERSLEHFDGYDYKKKETFLLIAESLPNDFAKENLDLIANTFYTDSFEKIYSKVFEYAENEPIDNELVLNNLKTVVKFINTNNRYEYAITKELKDVLDSLPENFLKENSIACLEIFNARVYKDLISKIIKDSEKENYEEITAIISWLSENADSKFEENEKEKVLEEIAEILPSDFIKNNLELMINNFNIKAITDIYEKIFEVKENENINDELTLRNMKLIVEYIKAGNSYYINGDCKKIIDLLPENFIKENIITCFEIFDENLYKELIPKFIKEPKEEDYEQISNVISWLAENLNDIDKYEKRDLFKEITNLLPSDFIKNKLDVLVNNIEVEVLESLYGKIFETNDEEINNEAMTQAATMLLENIEKNQLEDYRRKNAQIKLITSLPNSFFKNNAEFCFSKFDKEVYSDFIDKFFIYDDKNLDFEEIKNTLKFVKTKIDENFDYDDVIEKIKGNDCCDNVIQSLPIEFLKSNAEFVITLFENKISGKAKDYLLKNIPEDVIRKYETKFDNKLTIDNIGAYERYLEYIVSNPEMSIITSNIGIKIFEFINANTNKNEPEFVIIKEILEREKSKYEHPDMSKYATYLPENYSETFDLMNNEVFENFIKDIEKIKLLNGRIPEEYCDYIIKQKLTKNSPLNQNLDKYLPMLKRAFEDKVQHMLRKEGIEGYSINFFEKNGNVLGYHNAAKKEIAFLEDNLIELDENNTHIINTAFHEVKHAIQAKDTNTTDFSKLDGTLYNMVKEEIIRSDDLAFYNRNYTRMYCEIDARRAGTRGQAEYLRSLGVSEEQIIEIVGSSSMTLKEIVEKNMEEEALNTEYASNKVDKDGRIVSISQRVTELIKKKPDWLKEYPVLSLEFDENGERKNTVEILRNAIECKDDSVRDIYI